MTESAQRDLGLTLTLKNDDSSAELVIVRLDAQEGFSQPFLVTLDILSDKDINLLPNLGLPAVVTCRLEGEVIRHFHGVVIEARYLDQYEETGHFYRLRLAPAAHFHAKGSYYRIFQQKSHFSIITETLQRCGIAFETKVGDTGQPVPYCVQYGESDFAFASRLMEEFGYYYFYRHEAGDHKLVICDGSVRHDDHTPGEIRFNPLSRHMAIADTAAWVARGSMFAQAWHETASSDGVLTTIMRDYDFKQPAQPVQAKIDENEAHDLDKINDYQWQGRYFEQAKGDKAVEVLLQSHRAQRVVYEGQSQFGAIQPGFVVSLAEHTIGRYNDPKYLIISCCTTITNQVHRAGQRAGSTATVTRFTAITDDVKFRPPQITPRPVAKGPETAIVTGPAGEEIHVDEFGRVKVKFHWDLTPNMDETSSCWLRVSQFNLLGSIFHPRVGQEVLVDFINGNPDRPIVVGRVYNAGRGTKASAGAVYPLSQEKTKSVIRTKTYQRDGGVAIPGAMELDTGMPGNNEVRFEDKKDGEEILIHAERDMNTRIRHVETHHVGKDATIKIGNDRTEEVGHNETVTVKNDRSVEVKNNDTLKVGQHLKIDAGQTIDIHAGTSIKLSVGNSSILIEGGKITVRTLELDMGGTTSAKMTGGTAEVSAPGITTIKGSLVKINC